MTSVIKNKKCNPGPVLVISYGGSHARMLAPVVSLLRRKGIEVIVIGLTVGYTYFDDQNLDPLSLSDICRLTLRDAEISESAGLGKRLIDVSIDERVTQMDSWLYFGIGYSCLCDDIGKDRAEVEFSKLGRKSFRPVEFAKRVLNALKPVLIVTTNSPRYEEAFVVASRLEGVASIVAVDGEASQEMSRLSRVGYGDALMVLHQRVKQNLISLGRPAEDVIVTGNPEFDSLGPVARERIVPSRPTVLYLCQEEMLVNDTFNVPGLSRNEPPPVGLQRDVMMTLLDCDCNGAVRFHPTQSPAVVAANPGLEDMSSISLAQALRKADIVVTASSIAGIQATALGIPVLQLNESCLSSLIDFGDYGESCKLESLRELNSTILGYVGFNISPWRNLGHAALFQSEVIDRYLSEGNIGVC